MMSFSNSRRWLLGVAAAGSLAMVAGCGGGEAPETEEGAVEGAKTEFTVGWTIYAGWMPWAYAEEAGIVDKWAEKYGITIDIVQINDYVGSLTQFASGELDAVTSTNMDALTIPAASGTDTTALIVGDYSNGNDGLILKGASDLSAIEGMSVNLVQESVSQYFLARALESIGLEQADVNMINTSDADMVAVWSSGDSDAMATWNPMLLEIKDMEGANIVYDSSSIPGEILDMMVVNTDVLEANPDFGKALAGIWYETMTIMSGDDEAAVEARTAMATLSGTDLPGYEAQLATTFMYYDPAEAVSYVNSPEAVEASELVRQFCFAEGLFGAGASSVDDLGIEFPGGVVQGNPDNIVMRYNPEYMAMAAAGEL